jgi:hypothetical protein
MDKLEKVVVLDDEVQAEVVDSILSAAGIPHVMRTYHDAALDGLFQASQGWGHVEAPSDYRDQILTIISELKKQPSNPPPPSAQ